jgi:cytochrome c553
MLRHKTIVLELLCIALCTAATIAIADDATPRDDFETEVLRLLQTRCGGCHGSEEKTSGLSVFSVAELVVGGSTRGAAIIPGHPEDSVLLKMVSGQLKPRMPLKGEPLADDEIKLLSSWIQQLKAAAPAELRNDAHDWWAVRKIADPLPPDVQSDDWVHNPIDRFILSQLERAGFEPAAEASKAVLLRRAFFDLVGMPPTLEETREYLGDDSPDAYKRLVERLLADQRYGERWGRHWLDVVRYADSGGSEYDREYSHLWRYRDYVIRSFNDDKPYDRFVIEQLAGDEIDAPTSQSRVALGFLRLSPEHGSPNKDVNRQLLLNDMTSAVATAFLSVTLGCAQCHDHKYDPITQKDFYRLQAFFVGVRLESADVPFEASEVDRYNAGRQTAEQHLANLQERAADVETEFLSRLKDILMAEGMTADDAAKKASKAELERRLALAEPETAGAARSGPVRRFTAEERFLLTRLRNDTIEATADGTFEKGAARRRVDRYLPKAHVVTNTPQDYFATLPHLPVAFVRIRGEVDRLGEMVRPGFLSAVTGSHDPATARTDKFGNLEKFRIGLAEWIGSRENPLTSRVIVNRVWQHHFGQGIVRTANNFGNNGTLPTHPELLDWLATRLVENNWSLKAMHRLMMMSATYRQRSNRQSLAVEQVDPQNRLLWRMPRRRLEAEAIRDSILTVSGRLNPEMGGPSIYPPLPDGMEERSYYKHSRFWEPSDGPESRRRSVYIFNRRQLDFPLLAALDAPVFSSPNEQRAVSTTPLQALLLLNGKLVNEEVEHFARRVERLAGANQSEQVRVAYALALTRSPTPEELHDALSFLNDETGGEALAGLCRVLYNLNEFIYVD